MMRAVAPWILVAALGTLPAVARAEDPPASGGAVPEVETPPPAMPKGPDAFLAPVDAGNLHQWLGTLRKQMERFEAPPPSTADVTALRDAWGAILKPRIGRMLQRLKKWEDPARWEAPEGETVPTRLRPDQWPAFTGDVAQLATELHGAWKQYGSVEVRPKVKPDVYLPPLYRASPLYLNYAWPVLYGSVLDRQSAALSLGSWDGLTYWHLLGRFGYAWDWSWVRRAALWRHWAQRKEATEEMFEQIYADLGATREALAQTLLGLQVYLGALQSAEEGRLREKCLACRATDETLRVMAETALRDMAKARLEAERFQGDSYAVYGSLLRAWVRRQRAAAWVLEMPEVPLEPEPEASPGGK